MCFSSIEQGVTHAGVSESGTHWPNFQPAVSRMDEPIAAALEA